MSTPAPSPETPASSFAESGCYAAGDSVRLTAYHKDRRPTTIRSSGPESCVLNEARGEYYIWNYGDIEPHNPKVSDAGALAHQSTDAIHRRSLD